MIGALRERVLLQTGATGSETGGGGTLSWSDTATVFAAVTPLAGEERVQAERLSASATHRVVVRAGLAVAAGQRLVWRGRVLNIRAVLNLASRDRLLALLCEEGVAT